VETPRRLVERWTRPDGDGRIVDPRLRARIQVARLDLTREALPVKRYDVVVCRNVVIYFDRALQERLFMAFHDALVPGGTLVLGKVETLVGPARDALELVDVRERIYRRPA
jgi:chemotaxis methyl-accepting protein methylase